MAYPIWSLDCQPLRRRRCMSSLLKRVRTPMERTFKMRMATCSTSTSNRAVGSIGTKLGSPKKERMNKLKEDKSSRQQRVCSPSSHSKASALKFCFLVLNLHKIKEFAPLTQLVGFPLLELLGKDDKLLLFAPK